MLVSFFSIFLTYWLQVHITQADPVSSTSNIKSGNKSACPVTLRLVMTLESQHTLWLVRFPSLSSVMVTCFKVCCGHSSLLKRKHASTTKLLFWVLPRPSNLNHSFLLCSVVLVAPWGICESDVVAYLILKDTNRGGEANPGPFLLQLECTDIWSDVNENAQE